MTYWQSAFLATRVGFTPSSCIKLALTLVLQFAVINVAHADLKQVDSIAAIVNQNIVLMSELNTRTSEIQKRYATKASVLPPIDVLQKQILDQLILESIQVQLAKKAGLFAPIDALNNALDGYAKNANIDMTKLISDSPELYQGIREQIENQILISMIQQREVGQRIQVNQTEIDAYLDTKKGRAAKSIEYRFQYYRTDSEENANTVFNNIASGSLLEDQLQSRDLGFRTKEKLPSIFQNVNLADLKIGDPVPPVFANDSYHLIQLAETRSGNTREVEQVNARHILIKPNVLLTPEKAQILATELLAQINTGSDFATLATEYSDDISSRVQGGDLGWKDPATFLPEFKQALEALEVGETSELTETALGWHIIELIAVRTLDIGDKELRAQATQAIFQNRYQQELPRWVNEQRENAFVEIRL